MASFIAAVRRIAVKRPAAVALRLIGTGTAWTGGTTFTVSGVSGVAKTGQLVNSATSATVLVTTGATTGTLTVSDGTHATTVAVVNSRNIGPRWVPPARR